MGVYDRVLITGGGGMLAKALVDSLRARGVEARSRGRTELDITDAGKLREELKESRPTLLLNSAAYTKVDLCEDPASRADSINGDALGEIARLCQEFGTKLVHYSTDFVFDGQSRRPYLPSDAVNPLSAYGRSKLLGEKAIQKSGLRDWVIIRTAWLYGPGGACFPQTMINAAKAGKALKVVDDQIGSPTFTYDLAEATLNLVDHEARGIYHIVNSGETNWHDFTAAILDEFGLKAELSRTTSAEWKKARPNSAIRPAYSVLDTSAYTQLTGKTMRPWREALRDYHHHVR